MPPSPSRDYVSMISNEGRRENSTGEDESPNPDFYDGYSDFSSDGGDQIPPRRHRLQMRKKPVERHHFHIEGNVTREDKFFGDRSKFEAWSTRLNRAIKKRQLQVGSEECTNFIMSRMEGDANDWAENWDRYERDGDFIKALFDNYGLRSLEPYKDAIEGFQQKRGELLRDYKTRFQTLLRRLEAIIQLRDWVYPYSVEDESRHFISGLEEESPILFEELAKHLRAGDSWWKVAEEAIQISDNLLKNSKKKNRGNVLAAFSRRAAPGNFDLVEEVRTKSERLETRQVFQTPPARLEQKPSQSRKC